MLLTALLLLVVFGFLGWFVAKAFFIAMVAALFLALIGAFRRPHAGRRA